MKCADYTSAVFVDRIQQAEQQREVSQRQLALAKRKLAAEAEGSRIEKERVLKMQVRRTTNNHTVERMEYIGVSRDVTLVR